VGISHRTKTILNGVQIHCRWSTVDIGHVA